MVIVDDRGIIRLVNAQTEAMFGYPREELLGRDVEMLIPGRFSEAHRVHRRGYAANGHPRPMGAGLALRGLRRDGREFPVEISLSPLRTSEGLLVSAAVRDVTKQRRAAEAAAEFAAIVRSSQDAIVAVDLDGRILSWNRGAERIFQYTAEEIVGQSASLLRDELGEREAPRLASQALSGERAENRVVRRRKDGSKVTLLSVSTPVLDDSGAAVGIATIARDADKRERDEAMFRSLLDAAPDATICVNEEGVIAFVNARAEQLFGYQRSELAGQCVEILVPEALRHAHPGHRKAYTAEPAPRRMGEGMELAARRKDGTTFPAEVALSAVETEDGTMISAAVRDVSDRKAAEARINELASITESSQDAILTEALDGTITFWSPAAARMYGYSAAEAVGQHVSMLAPAEHRAEIDDLLLRVAHGQRIDHYQTLRVTRTGTLLDVDIMFTPMRGLDGAVVGVCSIARDISDHKRAEREITRLYQEQRHIALTLQQALMGTLPEVPGMDSASRYCPAAQGAGVGGDWFDLIPLGGGLVGMLIGDVMGRGVEAAAVMGQLRASARALARTGLEPRELMSALEAVAADLPDQLITCCYLIVNSPAGSLTACSAGHLPVLLVSPDGNVHRLPIPVSVPLGVGGIPHQQTTISVEPRATLALYTDGLVETPHGDLDEQVGALESALQAAFTATFSLDQAADHILAELLPQPGEPPDDVTLLLARIPPPPITSGATTIQPDPQAVSTGRHFTRKALHEWGLSGLADTACLLTSELLTNAVRHATNLVELYLHHSAHELIIQVEDDDPHLPQHRVADGDADNGRGLMLVDTLAGNWGSRLTSTGKTVWFSIPIQPASA